MSDRQPDRETPDRETFGSRKPSGRSLPWELIVGLGLAAVAVAALVAIPDASSKRAGDLPGRDDAAVQGGPIQLRDGGAAVGRADADAGQKPSPSADDVAAELKVAIKPDDVAVFMRAKLDRSQDVIKGLALGDFQSIYRAAHDLALASQASTWEVLLTEEYARQSAEFRRSCEALRKAARDENLDAAALAWMEVTMKCIQCHKYVREADGNLSAGAREPVGSK